MKIVIGVDGMSLDDACVRAASVRPWPLGSVFFLLSVINPYPFTAAPIVQDKLLKKVLQKLERTAQLLREAGWTSTTKISMGSPRRKINQFARDWEADLTMVGCNDLGDLTRLFLGSTAQSVLRHAPCSVEVVRPHRDKGNSTLMGGMKILIATDGSEFARAAIRAVSERPWPDGSEVKIICVPEFIIPKDPSFLKRHEAKDLGIAAIEDARTSVATGVDALTASGLKVSSMVPEFEDKPYKVILHEAEEWRADMIVLGSHGRTGFDRFIMGSVSEAVALHAQCSVEVIRTQTNSTSK